MGPPKEKLEPTKQPLTAVLLADSFTQRFRPITVERPKVLLPLANAPLIEYTLEWLALNKVEEIYVFCCAHADQIKRYLGESKWLKQRSPRITTVVSRNCLSAGEALRALDQKDIIKGDFILVSGDTVANVDLAPALAAHRARREKDKNAIMTMLMKRASDPHQRLRLGDAPLAVALDPSNQRLLRYADYATGAGLGGGRSGGGGGGRAGGAFKVDAGLFGERDGVQLRSDLMDCHIAICAPEVLMLFSDNFDYQHVKRDFVCGVLSEEELGNKVFLHTITREYAARVHNLRAYDAISRDLLQRWAFPFAPDTNVFDRRGTWGPSSYRYARGHRYLEATVSLARSASLGADVAIGAGSSVGDGSSVAHSVVGRGCRIGRNCVLRGAYLQDNVTLGDGCSVIHALLCEGVTLKPGAAASPGCVLSYGVVVGPKHAVPPGARVSLCKAAAAQGDASDDDTEYSSAAQPRRSGGSGAEQSGGGGGGRRGSRPGPSSSEGEESGGEESSSGSGSSSGSAGLMGRSMERPSSLAVRAAEALARGGPPPPPPGGAGKAPAFDRSLVGDGGAGYAWPARGDEGGRPDGEGYAAADDADDDDAAADATGGAAGGAAGGRGGAAGGSDSDSGESSGSGGSARRARSGNPEAIFCQEVAETYLRCVKLRFDQTNAVIELNGLKIAEDRTFADCARYMFTTMLGLCAPAAPHVASEYRELYPKDAPDVASGAGKVALLKRFRSQLAEWGPLLQRFLRSEDDQVELLLTLEEYCGEEGVFEGAGEAGPLFAAVFPQLLQRLYEGDVVDEAAFEAWAGEKAHADASERVFLDKAAPFLEWLRDADEDEDEDEDGSDE
ncbi:MAG: nucleotide-diphospho-sugar transferase [Monoraphidium minutum]|nr:MAG: nucleotide-diphospho-sugar transferase [Monoraphidium minutum]